MLLALLFAGQLFTSAYVAAQNNYQHDANILALREIYKEINTGMYIELEATQYLHLTPILDSLKTLDGVSSVEAMLNSSP